MTRDDYLTCLEMVLQGMMDNRTKLAFLESLVKHLPIGEQRGVRAYFADANKGLNDAIAMLQEQHDWVDSFCPPQMPEIEASSQLDLAFPLGEQPGYEDV